MGKYLDIIARVEQEQAEREKSDKSEKSYSGGCHEQNARNRASDFIRFSRFSRTLHELERGCPDHVDVALADGGNPARNADTLI